MTATGQLLLALDSRTREARGLSLEALAERSGLSSRSILAIEHGRSDMRLRSRLALAVALDVPPGSCSATGSEACGHKWRTPSAGQRAGC